MRIKKSFSTQQGSLLLEALLVIVILSVGLTFIIQSLSSSLRALAFSKSYSQAAFLIDNKFSEILLNQAPSSTFQDSGDFDDSFKDFHYKINASSSLLEDGQSNSQAMNQMKLTVSWQSGKNTHETSALLCLLNPSEDKKP